MVDTRPPLSSYRNDITGGDDFPTLNPSSSQPSFMPPEQVQEEERGFLSKAFETGKNVAGRLAQPFVSLGAAPVQGLAKVMGQPDPYAQFEEKTGFPAQPSPIDQPLRKVGEVGEIASYLFPYGRFVNMGMMGRLGGAALGGLGIDVSTGLASGERPLESLKPGMGTALTTAFPLAGVAKQGLGRVSQELLGVTTGSGYGVIRQAYEASKRGGEELKAFTEALRGKVTPDELVQEAREALTLIKIQRRTNYANQLKKIAGNKTNLDVSPINNELADQFKKFGIRVRNGILDFSQSKIRFDKGAQDDVMTIYDEMKTFGTRPGDRTAIGVDSLKQAFSDLYSKSSNVRALVTAVKKKTSDVLNKVDGYEDLSKDYTQKSGLIDEIQRGLSLGDQALIDTTYKKLISALRINNVQRKEMIESLMEASQGRLPSRIAGQQLSEALPHGIMRPLAVGVGGASAVSGGGLLPLLKFAAIASPRLVGESLRILGFTDTQITQLMNAIGGLETLERGVLPAVQVGRGQPQQESSPQVPGQDEQAPKPPIETYRL